MIRKLLHAVSDPAIRIMKPFKIHAYETRSPLLRGLILEVTSRVDWMMIFLNIQNNAMLMHEKVYGGNFLFGKGVMLTSYEATANDIEKPLNKCSHFMGVDIIASDASAFATNSGSLNQCPAARKPVREAMMKSIFTDAFLSHDYESVRDATAEIIDDWQKQPKMARGLAIRSTATRIFFKLLADTTVAPEDAATCTRHYIRRFGELSAFSHYFPFITGVLQTHKRIRQDAYFLLQRKYGLDLSVIEMTLFAAMFSVGTLVLRCVEDIQRFDISYRALNPQEKRNFVHEALRLWPTVTSVHRMVERDEIVRIGKREITLTPGDEVVYPFACSNRDPIRFPDPQTMKLDRPAEQYEAILSWSKGPYGCPGKEISILVTMVMLDALAEQYDLSTLKIFKLAF